MVPIMGGFINPKNNPMADQKGRPGGCGDGQSLSVWEWSAPDQWSGPGGSLVVRRGQRGDWSICTGCPQWSSKTATDHRGAWPELGGARGALTTDLLQGV